MSRIIHAIMFSVIVALFGGLFLSLVLGAFGVYSISYGVVASAVGLGWFVVELQLIKRNHATENN